MTRRCFKIIYVLSGIFTFDTYFADSEIKYFFSILLHDIWEGLFPKINLFVIRNKNIHII